MEQRNNPHKQSLRKAVEELSLVGPKRNSEGGIRFTWDVYVRLQTERIQKNMKENSPIYKQIKTKKPKKYWYNWDEIKNAPEYIVSDEDTKLNAAMIEVIFQYKNVDVYNSWFTTKTRKTV